MPRIIDRIDAAIGRTPEVLEGSETDYLTRRPGPERLVGPDGIYDAGWFEDFRGAINLEDSSAFDMAIQRWFHVSLDAGRHFVVFNLADLSRAGNTALLVADKETGAFEHASEVRLLPQNNITADPAHRRFVDPSTSSFAAVDDAEERFTFSLHARHLHLSGVARRAVGPSFIQSTRFHRGRGSLQWYGSLQLEHGTLTIGDRVIPLPPGCYGTYDRTVGHQRGIQNWNWIAAAGRAVDASTGREVELAFQIARDRSQARPVVMARKYLLWVDGEQHKIPEAAFRYEVTDPESRQTGAWEIHSPPEAEAGFELTFTPRFHRREARALVMIRADFNQYYGEVSGRIRLGGRSWRVQDLFAVTEDSWLEL